MSGRSADGAQNSSTQTEAAPVQDVQHLPALLHAAAGSGVLSNGGHGAQDGGPILPLQGAAANNHDGTFGSRKELQEKNSVKQVKLEEFNGLHVSSAHLAEGVSSVS